MDTILPAILLLIALLLWRAIRRIEQTDTRRRSYRADTVQRAVQRGDVEEDVIYIWRLQSSGFAASRRAVVRSHEMSAHRWNKAMAVIKHLRLDPMQTSYSEGVARVQGFFESQARLRQRGSFVPPVDQSE